MRSHGTRGPGSQTRRNRVREDPDAFDLDFDAISRPQVAGLVASLELAPSGYRPAAPDLPRVDRLTSGKDLDFLRESPQGPFALLHKGILVHHVVVSFAEPFLPIHADGDPLVLEFSEFVPRHDARAEGVRPVLAGSGTHPDFGRDQLDVPRGEIIEDRDAEEVRVRVPCLDPVSAHAEHEPNLRLVIESLRFDHLNQATLEYFVLHSRDDIARPDDVQMVLVEVRGRPVPLRGDARADGGARPGDVATERKEVAEETRHDRGMNADLVRSKGLRGAGFVVERARIPQHAARAIPCFSGQTPR